MKIQIKLTQAELRSIVARHLNLANGINANDLEITIDYTQVDFGKWTELHKWHTSAANNPNRKIEAIKGVRTSYPGTGLVEAKYAVEASWDRLYEFVKKYNSLDGFCTWR